MNSGSERHNALNIEYLDELMNGQTKLCAGK